MLAPPNRGDVDNATPLLGFHGGPHQAHQPEIELTSATTATGIWALEDKVIDTQHEVTITGAAYYRDEYVTLDGAWKIQKPGYERLFEEIESRKERKGLRLSARKFE